MQLPAIFLQQAISDWVMAVLGRQDSAGIAVHSKSKLITATNRQGAIHICYARNHCDAKQRLIPIDHRQLFKSPGGIVHTQLAIRR